MVADTIRRRFAQRKLKNSAVLVLAILLLQHYSLGQTDLDAVHVEMRTPFPTPALQSGLESAGKLMRVNVDLVMVPVTITDASNRLVEGLDSDNFQLFEGKDPHPQQIRYFSKEDAPISLGFILDVSGSMKSKIDRAREAVIQFAQKANPEDEFFLISFSDRPEELCDFTQRVEDIQSRMVFANPKGRTSLLDAIYLGINKMQRARYTRRALLIISYGGDNHSRYTLSEIKSLVREADVGIYAIGIYDHYFMTAEETAGPELLEKLSQQTGGTAFTIDNPGDMTYAANAIGNILRNQYLIGYRPQGARADGKWHRIKVKLRVVGRSKKLAAHFSVHAKSGYYARLSE